MKRNVLNDNGSGKLTEVTETHVTGTCESMVREVMLLEATTPL